MIDERARFFADRLTTLRLKRGVSEHRMSLDLGHSKNYIQNLTRGRSLPSFTEFLYICDYLQIPPSAFFDEDVHRGKAFSELVDVAIKLPENDQVMLTTIALRMKETHSK